MSNNPSHPSWALIALTHTQGHQRLFRSPTEAHSCVTLRISHASLDASHSHGKAAWPELPICEVRLSAVQFAELITQPNRGDGVPCTLAYLGAQRMPSPPPEVDDLHDHAENAGCRGVYESSGMLANLVATVESLVAEGKPLGVTALRKLLAELRTAHSKSTSDLDFWRHEMAERAESMRSKIATDLHATADLIVRRMGLGALAEKARAMLPTFSGRTIDVESESTDG